MGQYCLTSHSMVLTETKPSNIASHCVYLKRNKTRLPFLIRIDGLSHWEEIGSLVVMAFQSNSWVTWGSTFPRKLMNSVGYDHFE